MRVDRVTECAASVCVLGSGAAWSAALDCIRELSGKGKLRPVMLIEKCRYDETPLKVRIEGPASAHTRAADMETCQHGKVAQVGMTIHMVLQEISSGRRFLFGGRQPTALQTVSRTTSECLLQALRHVRAMIPGLEEASAFFENYLRVAVAKQHCACVASGEG